MINLLKKIFDWVGFSKSIASQHNLTGTWLIVTPVHWEASHNDAMILACGETLDLTEQQGQALYKKFSDFLKPEGMETFYHNPYTWLIQINDEPQITSFPPSKLIHQSITPFLKEIDKTHFWQRFMTEIQMLFHDNSEAKQVNGVWIWCDSSKQNKILR